ncbi:bactofilin family protein [Helicobacter pametensis]|uniref:bactofilin family protein n=1 Tax=Helicobacter pametensis TaxID=95149 RepID=UPI00048627F3|nr:polymer-forming cytoskeletal protein [Helicobacter pametensis]
MAVFVGNDKNHDGSNGATIIAGGTRITGEIHIQCHLHIDGEFDGVIHSSNTVNIGKDGIVRGDVFAEKLVVSGQMIGNVKSKIVEIMPYGKIDGKVSSHELVIERKGILTGESIVEDGESVVS